MHVSMQFPEMFMRASFLLFNLGNDGYTLHSLRRGGATHFFRVTGNLSETLERGQVGVRLLWPNCTYITEGLSIWAHRKVRPATATALRIAAGALPGKNTSENAASDHGMCPKQGRLQRSVDNGCRDVANGNALGNATSGHERCPRQG